MLIGEKCATLPHVESTEETYRQTQLVTYLGNKRKLLSFIGQGVAEVQRRLGREQLRCYDAFAGSGVVSRFLKSVSAELFSNDLEDYAAVLGKCYLANRSETPPLEELHAELLRTIEATWAPGMIAELYAPQDDAHIRPGERAFYTRRNAIYLDSARRAIQALPEQLRPFFLAPLLFEASVHTNTGGVFKGFYKNAKGVGQFGGRTRQALHRIMADIHLPLPVFSTFECPFTVLQGDATHVARRLPELDLAYLDPPYNQHPYGSNYFMLNLLTNYKPPQELSRVSGIPKEWNRSDYNARNSVQAALSELLAALPCKFALLSYNSEGLLSVEEITSLAEPDWHVRLLEQDYAAYRASRNLNSRSLTVREFLFILERK